MLVSHVNWGVQIENGRRSLAALRNLLTLCRQLNKNHVRMATLKQTSRVLSSKLGYGYAEHGMAWQEGGGKGWAKDKRFFCSWLCFLFSEFTYCYALKSVWVCAVYVSALEVYVCECCVSVCLTSWLLRFQWSQWLSMLWVGFWVFKRRMISVV